LVQKTILDAQSKMNNDKDEKEEVSEISETIPFAEEKEASDTKEKLSINFFYEYF
jgi:hypothetical protein